jgi:translation initiation factor 5B
VQAKKEQLRKEGKLLTKAQKEAQQRAQLRLQQMIDAGVKVEGLMNKEGESKAKRPVYDNRKKKKGPQSQEEIARKEEEKKRLEEEKKRKEEEEAKKKAAEEEDGKTIDFWCILLVSYAGYRLTFAHFFSRRLLGERS